MLSKIYSVISFKKVFKKKCCHWAICHLVNSKDWILRDRTKMKLDGPSGLPGSGAGKGGGGGGSVRESGGTLGEYGAAQEEHYFFNKQKEQLEKIKKKLKSDKSDEMSQKEEK